MQEDYAEPFSNDGVACKIECVILTSFIRVWFGRKRSRSLPKHSEASTFAGESFLHLLLQRSSTSGDRMLPSLSSSDTGNVLRSSVEMRSALAFRIYIYEVYIYLYMCHQRRLL